MIKFLTMAALLALVTPALAQDNSATADSEPTRIEVDKDNNRIVFFIDGVAEAIINKDGVHSRDPIFVGSSLDKMLGLEDDQTEDLVE